MIRLIAVFICTLSLVACEQHTSSGAIDEIAINQAQSGSKFGPGNVVARSANQACEVTADKLDLARSEFARFCGVSPRDCDPVNGQWVCSATIIGNGAPDINVGSNENSNNASAAQACSATGSNLNIAKQNFYNACSVPLRDCDPVDGKWLCSSEAIGLSAPAFAGVASAPIPVKEIDFLKNLSLVEQWNELALAAVRDGLARPTVTTHQLFMLSAAMYDAFAVYDPVAEPYAIASNAQLNVTLRESDVPEAVSQAAYQVLTHLFPAYEEKHGHFRQHLNYLGFRALKSITPVVASESPSVVGYTAAMAVLKKRSDDGSNYQNDYADITSHYYPDEYKPVNKPGAFDQLNDFGESFNPNRWQPLRVPTGTVVDGLSRPVVDELNLDSFGDQSFLTSHWGGVTPFSLQSGAELRPVGPPRYGSNDPYIDALGNENTNHEAYVKQVQEVVQHSANLNDKRKIIAEFWADGPRTESPPGHWNQLAHGIIGRDKMPMSESIKLFFVLNGALLDAGIATWETKRHYDYIRPASAIRFLYNNVPIQAWGGPGLGTQTILGQEWSPYQKLDFVTPPFPEYVSGHSTFSRAAADVLTRFTGSGTFYDGVTVTSQDVNNDGEADMLGEYIGRAGSFFIEDGPAEDVVLRWHTFKEAADEAGFSRLFGGIHIQDGDLRGRALGAAVAQRAYAKAQTYFNGSVSNQ